MWRLHSFHQIFDLKGFFMQRWTLVVALAACCCLGNVALAQPQGCLELALGDAVEGVADAGPYVVHSAQYCVRIPAGGLALRIELQSLGEGDLDLFVSVDDPIDLNDLFGTSDHIQISDSHNETLVIDQATFPPLVEGTYYIAVGNVAESPTPFRLSATLIYAQLRCAVSVQGQIQGKLVALKHQGQRLAIPISPSDDEYAIAFKIWEQASRVEALSANLVGTSLVFGNADVSFEYPLGVAILCGPPGAPLITDLLLPSYLPGAIAFDVLFSDLELDVTQLHITLVLESGEHITFTVPVDRQETQLGVISVSTARSDIQGLRGKRGKATVIVQLEDAAGQLSNAQRATTRLL